jgi:hypothetical protein
LDQTEVLFVNANCVELQLNVVGRNGTPYYPRCYMLTINALNRVLMRTRNTNIFANYFSSQLIPVSQYREYTMRYNQILSDNENKHLKENYDRVLVKMDDQSAQLAELLSVTREQTVIIKDMHECMKEILEVLKNISMAWSPQMILRMQFQQHVQNIIEQHGYDEQWLTNRNMDATARRSSS